MSVGTSQGDINTTLDRVSYRIAEQRKAILRQQLLQVRRSEVGKMRPRLTTFSKVVKKPKVYPNQRTFFSTWDKSFWRNRDGLPTDKVHVVLHLVRIEDNSITPLPG